MKILSGLLLACSILFVSCKPSDLGRGDGRIIGGSAISINVVPYQVSLRYTGSHTCGGSIISSTFILTACHCVFGKTDSSFSIRAGSKDQLLGGQIVPVSQIIRHPSYNPTTFDYDFALVRLTSALTLDGITKATISLPVLDEAVVDGTPVYISGWGTTLDPLQSNRYLYGTTVLVVNQSICNTKYSPFGVSKRMICAGAPSKDSCSGDSGGPMRVGSSGAYKVIGVVSFGYGCGEQGVPGVYARVASVRPWIKTNSGV